MLGLAPCKLTIIIKNQTNGTFSEERFQAVVWTSTGVQRLLAFGTKDTIQQVMLM